MYIRIGSPSSQASKTADIPRSQDHASEKQQIISMSIYNFRREYSTIQRNEPNHTNVDTVFASTNEHNLTDVFNQLERHRRSGRGLAVGIAGAGETFWRTIGTVDPSLSIAIDNNSAALDYFLFKSDFLSKTFEQKRYFELFIKLFDPLLALSRDLLESLCGDICPQGYVRSVRRIIKSHRRRIQSAREGSPDNRRAYPRTSRDPDLAVKRLLRDGFFYKQPMQRFISAWQEGRVKALNSDFVDGLEQSLTIAKRIDEPIIFLYLSNVLDYLEHKPNKLKRLSTLIQEGLENGTISQDTQVLYYKDDLLEPRLVNIHDLLTIIKQIT